MVDHYEINVSLNGKHLFATHPRSCRDSFQASLVWETIKKRFPRNEGYAVECTRWQATGSRVLSIVDVGS